MDTRFENRTRKEEADLISKGYKFDQHQHNGTVFFRVVDNQIEKAVVEVNGRVRKYQPYTPTSQFERERYGLHKIELKAIY